MRKRFALAHSVLALVILVAGGCASKSTSAGSPAAARSDGPANAMSITVDNGIQGVPRIDVYIVPQSGQRKHLGSVDAGKKLAFSYGAPAGGYTLVGVAGGGTGKHEIKSDRFQIGAPGTIVWRLPSNSIDQR